MLVRASVPSRAHASRHRPSRALRLALGVAICWALATSAARADVAPHGTPTCKTQAFFGFGVFTMNAPSGLSAGDVMIATVRRGDLFSFSGSGPSGWTEVASISSAAAGTWMRVATAGDIGASWTFASMAGFATQVTGTIVAFSGADPAAPLGAGTTSTGTATTYALPTVVAARAGSLRYMGASTTGNGNASFSGGTELCDVAGAGASIANAWEAMGIGASPARTATETASGTYLAQSLVIQPTSTCATGSRSLSAPSTVSFPSVALDGTNKTVSATATFTVTDGSDTAAGWNMSATSTTFTNGSRTLPTTATTVTGAALSTGAPNCAAATSSVGYPLTLPAGSPAPAATRLLNAAIGTGIGATGVDLSVSLAVPARAYTGTYTSTWTFTLAAGP